VIFRRSVNVPRLSDYHLYRDPYLRPDFQYRCAYCLTHEFYFLQGDGGEIDHHRPLHAASYDFASLKNTYTNLYWTCGQCNSENGNVWPTDVEYEQGLRFLDPCTEDHDDHWDTHPDGTVAAKTSIGHYTIRFIRLDRQRLTHLRRLVFIYQQRVAALEAELNRRNLLPEQRQVLLAYLADIKPLVDPPVFDR